MRLILTLLLLSVVASARADWVKHDEGNDGTGFYYDPTTIKKNGEIVRVWTIQDLAQRGNHGELSVRALAEYDCKNKRHHNVSLAIYSGPMASGDILLSGNPSGTWSDIPARSIAAKLQQRLCTDWVKFFENVIHVTFYYNPATIKKNGNLARVWTIHDLAQPGTQGELSRRGHWEYDCEMERLRLLYRSTHSERMALGKLLRSSGTASEWRYIPQEGAFRTLLGILCK